MPLECAAQPRKEVCERVSAAAVGVSCLGCGVGRRLKADLRRGDGDGPVTREGHREHRCARIVPAGGADGVHRLAGRHAADVGAADGDVREDRVLFRHEHHADGARRNDDGQHNERGAQGDLTAAAAGFSGFRLRRALCGGCLPGYGLALRRLLRRGGAAGGRLTLRRAVGGAAVCRALLRGEVRRLALCGCAAFGSVAVKFHDFGSCLSLSKSDYLNMYRGKPPPRRAGAWCAAAFRSAASSTGCARPCGRSVPRAACR